MVSNTVCANGEAGLLLRMFFNLVIIYGPLKPRTPGSVTPPDTPLPSTVPIQLHRCGARGSAHLTPLKPQLLSMKNIVQMLADLTSSFFQQGFEKRSQRRCRFYLTEILHGILGFHLAKLSKCNPLNPLLPCL